jgi:hypothetical protein
MTPPDQMNRSINQRKPRRSRLLCIMCVSLSGVALVCQFRNPFVRKRLSTLSIGRGLDEHGAISKSLYKEDQIYTREIAPWTNKTKARESKQNNGGEVLRNRAIQQQQSESAENKSPGHDDQKKKKTSSNHKTTSYKKKKLAKTETLRKGTTDNAPAKQSSVTFNSTTLAIVADVPADQECQTPREPIWEYYDYGKDHDTKASKRLLIGLYSGFGSYSRLLEMTGHVNRAYAKHWKHDVVVVQGAALRFPLLDGDCEPPPQRATFNKISILQFALKNKGNYDQLFIIDTDAMVYEMDFDVTTLLPDGHMLAAQNVKAGAGPHTWDINAGVTLWNLHHPGTEKVTKDWNKSARMGMQTNWHPTTDQFHLHSTLKIGKYEKQVHALTHEFNYGHGTIVRHFIRKPHTKYGSAQILDKREDRIKAAMDEVCDRSNGLCDAVEKKSYME